MKKYYRKFYSGNGTLLDVYHFYLTNEGEDWRGKMCFPTKQNISSAMLEIHNEFDDTKKALDLIDSLKQSGGRLFFWSDHHFFHNNIINLVRNSFSNLDEMHGVMLSNYKNLIKENDLVIFCGDVSFGHVDVVKHMFENLPGKKICVLGNHDINKGKLVFRNHNFFDAIVMCLELKINDKDYWLTHYPISHLLLPSHVKNIHGHTHQYDIDTDCHINVSVERVDYCPKQLEQLLDIKKK